MDFALQPRRLKLHHKLPGQRLDGTPLRSRLAYHHLVSRHRDSQRAKRSSCASELPFEGLHDTAQPLRWNPLCGQAPQRLHRYQIAEIEKSLAPARARLQKPQAGPIIELLPRRAGHALDFIARELLLHSRTLRCRSNRPRIGSNSPSRNSESSWNLHNEAPVVQISRALCVSISPRPADQGK